MAARGRKRGTPETNHNARIMYVFFGDDADTMTCDHTKWPQPYRDMYYRMFKKGYVFENPDNIKPEVWDAYPKRKKAAASKD